MLRRPIKCSPIFFNIGGQSNAFGSENISNLPPDLVDPIAGNFIANLNNGKWETLKANVNNGGMPIPTSGVFGVEMRLMQLLQQHYRLPIYLFKYTYYGTSIAATVGGNPDWSPSTGELFTASNASYHEFKAKVNYLPPLKFVIWMQGENDQDNPNYQALLTDYIAKDRIAKGLPELTYIIVRTGNLQTNIRQDILRPAQEAVGAMPYNKLVNGDGLPTFDGIHITAGGYDILAHRLLDTIVRL